MFNNEKILTVSLVTGHKEKSLISSRAKVKDHSDNLHLLKEESKTQGGKDPRLSKKCFPSLYFFSERSYAFESPEQFSKVNVVLKQTGRQFY